MKISIQGIKGSYHHQVAIEYFGDKINFKPDLITIFEVLEHVKSPEKAINNIANMVIRI